MNIDCWICVQMPRQPLHSGRKRRGSSLSFKESPLSSGKNLTYSNWIVDLNWVRTDWMSWRWCGGRSDAADCITLRGRHHLLRSVISLQLATPLLARNHVTSATSSGSSGSSGASASSGSSDVFISQPKMAPIKLLLIFYFFFFFNRFQWTNEY